MSITAIIKHLDDYLTRSGRQNIEPVEANALLAKAGLLRNRPGKPLRDLLRKGQPPHAFQSGGKGPGWTIPHSSKRTITSSNYPSVKPVAKKVVNTQPNQNANAEVDISQLKIQLEKARLKYKPDIISIY